MSRLVVAATLQRILLAKPFQQGTTMTEDLANLRLVNKKFCNSVSPCLFRHVIALAGSLSHTSKLPPLGRLVNLANSRLAEQVRRIDIGYGCFSYSIEEITLYMEDLAGLFSSCLTRFPNLEALYFQGPPSKYLLCNEAASQMNPVLTALCYVPIPNLTELDLRLPMTNNFAPLFACGASTLRIPIEQTLQGLTHLGLHVYAQTNQQAYAIHILRIIELSTSLTSLAISSQNYLSIDNLRLSAFSCLQSLCLQGVKTSTATLVSLLDQCNGSMEYIQLRHVKIEHGLRKDITSALQNLTHLRDFDIPVSGCVAGSESFGGPGLFVLDNIAQRTLKKKIQSNQTASQGREIRVQPLLDPY